MEAIKAESDVAVDARVYAVRCTDNDDSITIENQQKLAGPVTNDKEKICIFPKEAVKSNSKIIELIDILTPLLQDLLHDCNNVSFQAGHFSR